MFYHSDHIVAILAILAILQFPPSGLLAQCVRCLPFMEATWVCFPASLFATLVSEGEWWGHWEHMVWIWWLSHQSTGTFLPVRRGQCSNTIWSMLQFPPSGLTLLGRCLRVLCLGGFAFHASARGLFIFILSTDILKLFLRCIVSDFTNSLYSMCRSLQECVVLHDVYFDANLHFWIWE
jgi:hypothetical protein